RHGLTTAVAWCVAALGVVATGEGACERAARLLGAATAVCPSFAGTVYAQGVFTTPIAHAEAEARAALGDGRFEVLFAEGRALGPEQAVTFALSAAAPAQAPAGSNAAAKEAPRADSV